MSGTSSSSSPLSSAARSKLAGSGASGSPKCAGLVAGVGDVLLGHRRRRVAGPPLHVLRRISTAMRQRRVAQVVEDEVLAHLVVGEQRRAGAAGRAEIFTQPEGATVVRPYGEHPLGRPLTFEEHAEERDEVRLDLH